MTVAARRGRYVSDSILARRRRMLDAAKEMIAEGGSEGFTIRDLGRRAGVSITTIYAAHGDKQGVIAAAIEDFYDHLPLARAPATTSLAGVLKAADEAQATVLANAAYARHYVELYFSKSTDPRVYRVIQDTSTAASAYLPWLRKAMRDGEVLPGLDLPALITLFANNRLLALQDWARGRIADDDLSLAIRTAFLLVARAVTLGRTQARVEAALRASLRAAAAAPEETE